MSKTRKLYQIKQLQLNAKLEIYMTGPSLVFGEKHSSGQPNKACYASIFTSHFCFCYRSYRCYTYFFSTINIHILRNKRSEVDRTWCCNSRSNPEERIWCNFFKLFSSMKSVIERYNKAKEHRQLANPTSEVQVRTIKQKMVLHTLSRLLT